MLNKYVEKDAAKNKALGNNIVFSTTILFHFHFGFAREAEENLKIEIIGLEKFKNWGKFIFQMGLGYGPILSRKDFHNTMKLYCISVRLGDF